MNDIQMLLAKSLKHRHFHLDLQRSSKRILFIASQDLTNYLCFHWKLAGKEVDPTKFDERIRDYALEKPEELTEFLDVWSGIWIKKWNERVKLVQETEESPPLSSSHDQSSAITPIWEELESRSEIKSIIVEALIRNGEICGTSILAEHLLKTELISMRKNKKPPNGFENLLKLIKGALIKASSLSRTIGPAIFIVSKERDFP